MNMPEQRKPSSLNGFDRIAPSDLLVQLERQCLSDSARWFPGVTNDSLVHHVLALAGEVGEVANIVKKLDRGDKTLENAATVHELREEVADVFIYLLNIAGMLNMDLYKAYCAKRTINEKRWGNK